MRYSSIAFIFIYVLLYLALTDTLRPWLIARGGVVEWWIALGLFLAGSYVAFSVDRRTRGISLTWLNIIFLLFSLYLVLYDPTVRVPLAQHGAGWLWIVALILTLAFIAFHIFAHREKKDAH